MGRSNKKKSQDEYIEDVKIRNQNFEVVGLYINAKTKIEHKCTVCGKINKLIPSLVLNGSGCPSCDLIKRTYSHEEYVNKVYNINKGIEITSQYTRSNKNVELRCLKCGFEKEIQASALLKTFNCPKCHIAYNSKQKFLKKLQKSNYELIGEYNHQKNYMDFKCKKCKNVFHITGETALHNKKCVFCSKQDKMKTHEEFINEINNIHDGTIKILENNNGAYNHILAKCNKCDNVWSVSPTSLRKNGCPECSFSHGEKDIERYLKNHSISFESQKRFSGLRGIGKGLLSYDLYLFQFNLLIEHQGIQHYEPIKHFGGEEKFIIQQEHDKRKRDYARLHNINLLEIRYDEDANVVLDNYFSNLKNQRNLNSKSVETVIPSIAI